MFISVAAKMPLLFIVKSMTGRNLSSSTNKSLWRKTRKELNSRPFLSLREQRKPSETKWVPFQVRSETWHHRFPPYIFLLFSCSLIIGWTECKRQYEQRGSMPVGAWWRSAAKCIVVNQQLHGSKSKHEWQCWKTSTITRFSAGQIQKYPLSGKQRTNLQLPLRTKLNIVFAFFLLRTFEWTAIYTTVFTKCPHNTHETLFWQQWCVDRIFFNGKIMLKKWRFDHPLWSRKMAIWKNWPGFRKTKNLGTSIRTSNSGSLPPEKTAKNCDCPIIVGTGACLGHNYQMVFLSFFQWLEQRSQSQQSEIRYKKKQFLFMTNKKRKQILSRSRLSWKVGPKWVEKTAMNWNPQSACVV